VLVDLVTDETRAGDVYLLCSDGLTGLVSDDQIQEVVASIEDLEAACGALIERANFFGGSDNITVVLARVEAAADEDTGPRSIGDDSTQEGGLEKKAAEQDKADKDKADTAEKAGKKK
jgi:protein phosphatase